jgi:hypothetical protein
VPAASPKPPDHPGIRPLKFPAGIACAPNTAPEISADMAIRTAGLTTLFPLLRVPAVAARRTELGRASPRRRLERLIPLLPRYLLVRVRTGLSQHGGASVTMRGVERMFATRS